MKAIESLSLPENADLRDAVLAHDGVFPFGWGRLSEPQALRLLAFACDENGIYRPDWLIEARQRIEGEQ